jgi:putative peptidoglycan lipid II flippase
MAKESVGKSTEQGEELSVPGETEISTALKDEDQGRAEDEGSEMHAKSREHLSEEQTLEEIPSALEPASSVAEIPVTEVQDKDLEVLPHIEESELVSTGIRVELPAILIETTETAPPSERRHLVKSAGLVAVGNLGSSLLGMVRQIAVTSLMGPTVAGAFSAAIIPVTNFYQLLVNGSTDGALVPVFNDYAAPEKRLEMRRVVFTIVNLVLIIGVIASIAYAFFAPWFLNLLVSGYSATDKALTVQYSQIIFFSLIVLGPFAVLLAALFAVKEFGWPAFATASYHAGVIVGAVVASLLASHTIGLLALPLGLLLGAAGQIALLLPGIRNKRLYYMFVLDLKHPAFRRIVRLYWPIAISFVVSMVFVFIDLHLQSLTPNHAATTTAMATATTLIQFPIGLVAQALAVAVLPTLSEHAREGQDDRFKATLLLGIRLGLLLMIPAMTGLLVLRLPIVDLIFAHKNYVSGANLTALALQNYAYQLPFVALDQLLIAAFYARKNTRTPVIIGIVSNLFYLAVALPFYSNIGLAALAFANTVQNTSHAIILLILLRLAIGSLHIRKTIPAILKICLAAALMGAVAWGAQLLLGHLAFFSLDHLIGQFLTLVIAGGLAVLVYVGAILLFKIEEINMVKGIVMAKLGKK